MTTTTHPRPRPARRVLRLLPLGMAVMVAADVALGDRAEYFNAAELLGAWADVATGRGLGPRRFLHGQESLGPIRSLAIGSVLFVLEPAVALAALVGAGGAIRRLGSSRRRSVGRSSLSAT